jgi:hypothetical protein
MQLPLLSSQWPPELSEDKLQALVEQAILFALSHGLLHLPPPTTAQARVPTAAIHVPFALFPALFPRRLFLHAQKLQRMYNILYTRVAMDEEFLDCVMGEFEGVGKVDRFVGCLWRIWKDLRCEGLAQV